MLEPAPKVEGDKTDWIIYIIIISKNQKFN